MRIGDLVHLRISPNSIGTVTAVVPTTKWVYVRFFDLMGNWYDPRELEAINASR